MKQSTAKWNSILWNEAFGFSLMIVLSWLTELLHIPHLIFGEPFTPNWHRALLRTVIILLIWAWVHWITRRLLKRLHYLEEFLRICSWCRKVCDNDKWLTMEDYFNSWIGRNWRVRGLLSISGRPKSTPQANPWVRR